MVEESAYRERFGALLDAVDDERCRLASHLHDKLAQNLAVVSMHLTIIKDTVRQPAASQALRECDSLMEDAIRDVRAITYYLQPPMIAELGLSTALGTLSDTFVESHGFPLELHIDAAEVHTLSPETQVAIFRILRDAARGLASAGAAGIHLRLTTRPGGAVITIGGRCGPDRVDPANTLFWSVVQERVARRRGHVRLTAGELTTEIEIILPVEK